MRYLDTQEAGLDNYHRERTEPYVDDVIGRKTAVLKEQNCRKAVEVQHTQGETQDRQAKEPPESLSLLC